MGLRIALTHEFCWPYVRRGGERYLHELAASLARIGHEVTILAGGKAPSIRREDGVRVIRLPRGTTFDARLPRTFLSALTAALAAGRFDVVHSLGPRDAVASLRAKRLHRARTTVYTDLGNPKREWWERHPHAAAHARVVREIDVYGALARYGLSLLEHDYGRPGVLTPGGVRLDVFRPVADREPSPTLLYSGVLTEPRKGVATLLEAVAILAADIPDVRLWLSGPGDPTALLEAAPRAARDRTEVLPLGRPDDQPERYSRAWTTVLPSVQEAFGLVLVESLACGTPIVGSDDGALPELVTEATGAVAAPGDPASIADACRTTLELATTATTRDACREASRRHDWDTSVTPLTVAAYLSAR